jgi:hypothetical protein
MQACPLDVVIELIPATQRGGTADGSPSERLAEFECYDRGNAGAKRLRRTDDREPPAQGIQEGI